MNIQNNSNFKYPRSIKALFAIYYYEILTAQQIFEPVHFPRFLAKFPTFSQWTNNFIAHKQPVRFDGDLDSMIEQKEGEKNLHRKRTALIRYYCVESSRVEPRPVQSSSGRAYSLIEFSIYYLKQSNWLSWPIHVVCNIVTMIYFKKNWLQNRMNWTYFFSSSSVFTFQYYVYVDWIELLFCSIVDFAKRKVTRLVDLNRLEGEKNTHFIFTIC